MVDMLEKFFSAPAIALDRTVDTSILILRNLKQKVVPAPSSPQNLQTK